MKSIISNNKLLRSQEKSFDQIYRKDLMVDNQSFAISWKSIKNCFKVICKRSASINSSIKNNESNVKITSITTHYKSSIKTKYWVQIYWWMKYLMIWSQSYIVWQDEDQKNWHIICLQMNHPLEYSYCLIEDILECKYANE